MASELTVTVTIQLPDDVEGRQKILALLREATDFVSNAAHRRIHDIDMVNGELEIALPTNMQPESYKKRITNNFLAAQSWNSARLQAERPLWAAFNAIHKAMGLR